MKTFKQFNQESQYHLNEVKEIGLGMLPFKVAKFAFNNLVKRPVVAGVRKAYGTYKGIRNFVKNKPNATKFEIDQMNRDAMDSARESK